MGAAWQKSRGLEEQTAAQELATPDMKRLVKIFLLIKINKKICNFTTSRRLTIFLYNQNTFLDICSRKTAISFIYSPRFSYDLGV